MTGVLLQDKCCPEACCLPDGTCENLTRAECLAQGGTPQGCGTKCADPDIECEDTQACCIDGNCLDLPPAECKALGGTPQGKGTECADVNCVLCGDCSDCPTTLNISIVGFRADFVGGGVACEVTDSTTATHAPDTCTWVGDNRIGKFPCEFFVTLFCLEIAQPDSQLPLPAGWVVTLIPSSPSPSASYTKGPPNSSCPPIGGYDVFSTFGGPGFIIVDPGICEVN